MQKIISNILYKVMPIYITYYYSNKGTNMKDCHSSSLYIKVLGIACALVCILPTTAKAMYEPNISTYEQTIPVNHKPTHMDAPIKYNSELSCLAQVIHHEARGEPYLGKVAVGAVVINRLEKKRIFKKNTICGVVTAKDQFTNFRLGRHKPSKECIKAAYEALHGTDPTNGAVYFHRSRNPTIGAHRFSVTFKG